MSVLVAEKSFNSSYGITSSRHGIEVPSKHTVRVLYLAVPNDTNGGHLEILGLDPENLKPIYTVYPQINKMFKKFRGDVYHQAKGYDTNSTEQRGVRTVQG